MTDADLRAKIEHYRRRAEIAEARLRKVRALTHYWNETADWFRWRGQDDHAGAYAECAGVLRHALDARPSAGEIAEP